MDYNLDVFNGHGVDAGEWFVEHDEFGVDGEAACYLGASAFAAGELVAEVFAYFLEAEFCYEAFEFLALVFGRFSCHLEHGADVVFNGHFAEHGFFLCEVSYSCLGTTVDGVFCDVEVVEEDSSFVGCDKAYGHVECGGFACAVGAEEAYDFALFHIDGDMVGYGALSVFLDEVVGA